MNRPRLASFVLISSIAAISTGCRSPYRSDQGALFGGLTGAGLGAIIGHQTGNAGAGAAIGAAAGALSGAVVGNELDHIEASNRAAIEQQLGRPVRAGAVTMDEVITMTQSGVSETLIVNHLRSHGVATVPTAGDLITLKQAGVADSVVAVMQSPPVPAVRVVPAPAPQPVIIEEYHYGWPRYHHPHYRHYHHRPGHVHWGVSVGH
jgi:hypothetical protein